MQVIVGSLIVPRLQAYVKRETIRLGLESANDDEPETKCERDVEMGQDEPVNNADEVASGAESCTTASSARPEGEAKGSEER